VILGGNHEVSGFIKADGKIIRNGAGEELLLRGVGLGSWLLPEGYMWKFPNEGDRPRRIEAMIERLIGKEMADKFWDTYYDRYIAEEDIEQMAAEGFNSVRIPINARFLMDESETLANGLYPYREERLKLIDRMIEWCRKHKLYVILDLHGAPGGQTGTNIDDSAFNRPDLFMVKTHWQQTVDLWGMLADRYKDEWIVAGYDLLNEPLPEWFSSLNHQVMPLYREIVQAIRKVDQRHMIILEGVHWSTDWSIFEEAFAEDDPFDDNLLLQFHKYWNNPDTESIHKYLAFREKWNVPIFMGEGGENHNDWYAGAFRLLEDYNISWNFWTWKKLGATTSPCSIRIPEGWGLLVDYLHGGAKPSADTATRILWSYLDNMRFANCDYCPEVVRSLMRRPPVRIPAVYYGYKGVGVSFGLASGDEGAERTGDGDVSFRTSDRTAIQFVDNVRTVATFVRGEGEEWEPDQYLCLVMSVGDWFRYDFIGDFKDPHMKLTARFKLQAAQSHQSGTLEVQLDGKTIGSLHVRDEQWREYGGIDLGIIQPGEHKLTLRCIDGKLRMMWLMLDKEN